MIWSRDKLPIDVRSLLDRERPIRVPSAAAHARAHSRALAALAAGVATRPLPPAAPSTVGWAAAAALACVAAVAAGAATYEVGVRARPTAPVVAASPPASLRRAPARSIVDLPVESVLAGARSPSRTDAVRMELRLLEQARAAVAREDFARAIQLLAEHARRFRTGRLVEEREALRVRALAGLGRRSDARRAAADFEARFPRSRLLPTVSQMPDAAP